MRTLKYRGFGIAVFRANDRALPSCCPTWFGHYFLYLPLETQEHGVFCDKIGDGMYCLRETIDALLK